MSNKYENYSAEEFIKLCFADDALRYDRKNKIEYKFWDNFEQIKIKNWKEKGSKFYDTNKYESLPDPDATSKKLYEAHKFLWDIQSKEFKIPEKTINRNCELKIVKENICLGSDSIMSIYWHWAGKQYPYKNMQEIIDYVNSNIENTAEYRDLCKEIDENFSDAANLRHKPDKEQATDIFKNFIWCYLQKANTIGGFVLFPRHPSSINSMRGCNSKIRDRFDLTLECIRRAYQENIFDNEEINPLLGISSEDKKFFRIFGSFENYAKFFCLNKSYDGKHNWVTEDCSAVYDLMSENGEDTLSKKGWPKEILPCDYEEKKQVAKWWTFYHNIMNRLDARNQQIKEIIEKSL